MLHIIGIGLKKEHLTLEQAEIIKRSDLVFLEYYTSFYEDSLETFKQYTGKDITVADREFIEQKVEKEILEKAKTKEVSLLVIGDPLIATTHTDLILRAKELQIEYRVYHNVSIGNLITRTGLQFYKFGKITSIPFVSEKFFPRTPFLIFHDNLRSGAHSLFLLDLNPSGDDAYKSTEKYLRAKDALEYLVRVPQFMVEQEELEEKDSDILGYETMAIICSKLGTDSERIVYGTIEELIELDEKEIFSEPLCVIIPGDLHEMELEFLSQYKL